MTTIYVLADKNELAPQEITNLLNENNYRIIESNYSTDVDLHAAVINDLNQADSMLILFSASICNSETHQFIYKKSLSYPFKVFWVSIGKITDDDFSKFGVEKNNNQNIFITHEEGAILNEILTEFRLFNLGVSRHHLQGEKIGVYLNYENGINRLLSRIKSNNSALKEALIFQQRLYENLEKTRNYGSDPTLSAQRSEIVDNLNQLTMDNLRISFNDLCMEHSLHNPENSYLTKVDQEKLMYLRQLRTQLGYVNLSRISEDKPDVQLERIYVPLPVDKSLSVDLLHYRICNWWISEPNSIIKNNIVNAFGKKVDTSVFDALIGDVQTNIDAGIDKYFSVPADRPLILAPPWYEGEKYEFWPLYAADIASAIDRLVVIGPPGSGKSSFLKYLAVCLIGESLSLPASRANIKSLGRWPHGGLIPIFIELRKFIGWEKFPSVDKTVNQNIFFAYIKEEILGDNLSGFIEQIKTDLFDGNAIIIFDGLDEIPVTEKNNSLQMRQKQIQQLIRSLNDLYPKSRIIISSRDYGYHGWTLDNFVSINLTPLSMKEMKGLANNLFNYTGQLVNKFDLESNLFLDAIAKLPDSLKDRPLFLTLLAIIFLSSNSKTLPTTKGELYYKSILLLLDRWTVSRLGEQSIADQLGCSIEELYERLEVVAYRTFKITTADKSSASLISEEILVYEFFKLGEDATKNLYKIIAYLSQQSGVLLSPSTGKYQFAHRSFQEYLAASYMARNDDFTIIRDAIESQPVAWRETCLLIGDALLINQERGKSKNTVVDLLYSLIDFEVPSKIDQFDSRFWSVWLATKIAHNTNTNKKTVEKRHLNIFESLKQWILKIIEVGGLPPSERIELATILGIWDEDDRIGVGVKEGMPEIAWCKIPKGKFNVGLSETQIKKIQSLDWGKDWEFTPGREYPVAEINIDEYYISKYPITQKQFNAFVNHDEGYWDDRWWTNEGLEWRKINAPTKGKQPLPDWGNRPNYPATNVSWYASIAFCNWLTYFTPGLQISLPTEAEWEKSARGNDGRFFPWGDDFDTMRCNVKDTEINSVCPVGCFPLPDGPWDANSPFDMCGNVWEWCSTIYEVDGEMMPYPYQIDEREDILKGDKYLRIVRGGCYLNIPFVVKNTFRGRDKPNAIFGRQGFRIVAYRDNKL